MTDLSFPSAPDLVTPAWLTSVLRDAGAIGEANVRSLSIERVGEGVGFVGQIARITPADVRARSRTVADTRISPGAAALCTRDATCTAPPWTLLPSRTTSPAWMPRWSGRPASFPRPRQRTAASIACRADVNTAITPSPSTLPSTGVPPASLTAARSDVSSSRSFSR